MNQRMNHDQFFKKEIAKYCPYLKKFLYTLTMDPILTEDLLQETLCSCWKNMNRVRRYKNLRAALLAIAKNEFRQYMRAKSRRPEELVPTENLRWIASNSDIDDFIDREENLHKLLLAFNGINKEYVQIVILVDYYGFHPKEVAKLLSRNYNTVVSQHARGLKQMRKNIERSEAEHSKSKTGSDSSGGNDQ